MSVYTVVPKKFAISLSMMDCGVLIYMYLFSCRCFMSVVPGLELLIEHYQREKKAEELPCKLEKPCAAGQPPPPLSLSVGYTNILHKAISAGICDIIIIIIIIIINVKINVALSENASRTRYTYTY